MREQFSRHHENLNTISFYDKVDKLFDPKCSLHLCRFTCLLKTIISVLQYIYYCVFLENFRCEPVCDEEDDSAGDAGHRSAHSQRLTAQVHPTSGT